MINHLSASETTEPPAIWNLDGTHVEIIYHKFRKLQRQDTNLRVLQLLLAFTFSILENLTVEGTASRWHIPVL